MKATFFSLEYPPNVYGGAGVHVHQLTKALAKRIDVEVRCAGEPGEEEMEGVRVRRYAGPSGENKTLGVLEFDTRMLRPEVEGDIVHAHTWYAGMAGFWAKTMHGQKMVCTVHSLEPLRPWKEEQLGRGYEMSKWMERTAWEGSDGVIAVSSAMKKDVMECYDIESERIEVIPNGVDPERFYPREGREALARFGLDGPFVLFVGRMSRQKGINDLLAAWKLMDRDGQLALVTGTADTPEIEAEVRSAVKGDDSIVWINEFLGEEEVCQLYTHAELFACPSRYEPCGIINLEAMACGTAVLATRVGGIVDAVADGETGVLIKPEDPGLLAESIGKMLDDAELRARMGKAGIERVRSRFTWDKVAGQTVDYYEKVLDR